MITDGQHYDADYRENIKHYADQALDTGQTVWAGGVLIVPDNVVETAVAEGILTREDAERSRYLEREADGRSVYIWRQP